ncbi:hypothetical protein K0M31_020309, partial [Melipona bicolor]
RQAALRCVSVGKRTTTTTTTTTTTFSCVSFRGKSTTTRKDDEDFGGLYTSGVDETNEKPQWRASRQKKEEKCGRSLKIFG